jgi:catechol 2,3-dioxygenase-like lactoylglutathione lyase family enzyme
MTAPGPAARLTALAPQLLVDDLARSIAFYQRLGFAFGAPWDGFYAIGVRDGFELHLKEAPRSEAERRHRREQEHLDAAGGVDGIESFHAECLAIGAMISRPLAATAWGTHDFCIEDPDGNIIAFGGRPSNGSAGRRAS